MSSWHVFKDRQHIGIVVTNLPYEMKHWQQRANAWDSERETFHTYQLVPSNQIRTVWRRLSGVHSIVPRDGADIIYFSHR